MVLQLVIGWVLRERPERICLSWTPVHKCTWDYPRRLIAELVPNTTPFTYRLGYVGNLWDVETHLWHNRHQSSIVGLESLISTEIANKDYLDCCKTGHKPLGKHSFSNKGDLRRAGCKYFEHTAFCENGQCSGKGRRKSHDHPQADQSRFDEVECEYRTGW